MLRYLRMGNKRVKMVWWFLIVITVVTFVGGFVFLLGSGLDSGSMARAAGAVGVVNGERISRAEWQSAIEEQRAAFRQQYGQDPQDRDAQVVEVQAWRSLVTQRLLAQEARRLGLAATDREVVLALQTSPPAMIATSPMFQTNGQFDPQKYAAAMRDPGNNWAPFEDLVRRQLPVRKLQERFLASIKLSQPELERSFHDRFDRVSGTIGWIPASNDTGLPPPDEAAMNKVYDAYRTRFATGSRTQVDLLAIPKQIGEEEIRAARETAMGLVQRARAGEDFGQLARDYSEGPNADQGGVVDRLLQPTDFGPALGPRVALMAVGDVSDPVQDGTRFLVIKLLERAPGSTGVKVAQIVTRVRPNEDAIREQYEDLLALRKRAASGGLGRAAAGRGLATARSEFFDENGTPQALFNVPAAADWAVTAPQGAVSPVFEGTDEFAIVEVAVQQPAGVPTKEVLGEQLRQLADIDRRVDRAKPRADAAAAAIAAGRTLEQAIAAENGQTFEIADVTRRSPDPRLGGAPEILGAMFGTTPGAVVGPVRGLNGWYFGRVRSVALADTSNLTPEVRGQMTQEILTQRQQAFFQQYIAALRGKAKIEDLRGFSN
jgi:peptidyl-prolyl cis-trans isomerase D